VVAGDLLDLGSEGHRELDALLRRHQELLVLAVPGNHDQHLRQALFAARNIQVFASPTLKRIDGRPFLFLPYQEGRSMGAAVEESGLASQLPAGQWVLISHGDFAGPRREDSGEEGGYFPLTRQDLGRLHPARVILGHIHLPGPGGLDAPAVSPGSPYPLSAAEHGPRRVLLLDTDTAALEELPLSHTPVFVEARLLLLPDGREAEQVRAGLAKYLDELDNHSPAALGRRLRLRVSLQGYATSRQGLEEETEAFLAARAVQLEAVALDRLEITSDTRRAVIAQRVRQTVASLQLDYPDAQRLREEVLTQALRLVCRG
jgi:DNA repair exonuclease SbcCD nuclease subunit